MQDAETSKIMLPCHLHTSASFKTIFDQITPKCKNDAKIDPKMSKQSTNITIQQMMRKNNEKY